MRQYRRIARSAVKRRVQTVFRGYRSGSVIGSGECSDMKNLTSDDYPLLSVRKARYAYAELDGCTLQDCIALHSRSDHPVVCNNFGQILCHGHTLDGLLVTQNGTVPPSMLPKKMVSMGAWCVIFPDKVWFDALKLAEGAPMQEGIDFGALDNEVRVKCGTPGAIGQETVRFTSVLYDGTGYVPYDATQITYGQAPPTAPEHSSYWCDTSQPLARMLVYDAGLGAWNPVQTTYVRITATDRHGAPKELGKGFRAGDGISIRGLEGRTVNAAEGSPVRNHVFALNGMHTVAACDKQTLIIKGCIGTDTVTAANALVDGDIVIARLAPDMDYVVECGNRLWGCKYGEADGVLVNELYASKLGDFTNWQSYQGISTDSYTASRGAEGCFTGAAVLENQPLFFRENSFEKVFPSENGAHQILTVRQPGIQRGSWQSAKVIEGVLYYKGTDGIYAYTGSVPRCISAALGEAVYTDACADAVGTKYYCSMQQSNGSFVLFVYDTVRRLWHKEDNTQFLCTAAFGGALYVVDGEGHGLRIGGVSVCKNVPWMAQSGLLGLNQPDQKRIGRLCLRLQLELGASMRILVQYNSDGCWHEKAQLHGNCLQTVTVPIVPIRCDHLQLRLEGCGGMRLYSVAYEIAQGGDVP